MQSAAIHQLLRLTREYERKANVGKTTLSYRLFRDSKKLRAIEAGADLQTRRLEAALAWLSANWPAAAQWPSDIPRPPPAPPPSDHPPAGDPA